MSKYTCYCKKCNKDTLHLEYTEDAYGASGGARILTSIISLGMSNLTTDTYLQCLSCGKERLIK